MNLNKRILRLFGWLLTIILQAAAGLLLTIAVAGAASTLQLDSRYDFLVNLMLWLGPVAGINLVGWMALNWVWKDVPKKVLQRLIGCGIGALIGWLFLLVFGSRIPVGNVGTPFYYYLTYITLLVFVLAGLVGYYVPGLRRRKG
jgi:hypothetical protein